MPQTPFRSSCPIVRHEHGTFARLMDVSGGRNIRDIVTFTSDIEWLRESQSDVVIRGFDGEILHRGESVNDSQGFFTSIVEAFAVARRIVDSYGIGPAGPAAIEVRLTVTDRPVFADVADVSFKGSRNYRDLPDDWMRPDDPAIEEWRASRGGVFTGELRFIEPVTVVSEVVWTSRKGMWSKPQRRLVLDAVMQALDGVEKDEAVEVLRRVDALIDDHV